jgi:hypothetical protein
MAIKLRLHALVTWSDKSFSAFLADRIFARATHWCVLWCNANLTKLSPKATAGDSSGLLFILIFPEEALNDP